MSSTAYSRSHDRKSSGLNCGTGITFSGPYKGKSLLSLSFVCLIGHSRRLQSKLTNVQQLVYARHMSGANLVNLQQLVYARHMSVAQRVKLEAAVYRI